MDTPTERTKGSRTRPTPQPTSAQLRAASTSDAIIDTFDMPKTAQIAQCAELHEGQRMKLSLVIERIGATQQRLKRAQSMSQIADLEAEIAALREERDGLIAQLGESAARLKKLRAHQRPEARRPADEPLPLFVRQEPTSAVGGKRRMQVKRLPPDGYEPSGLVLTDIPSDSESTR